MNNISLGDLRSLHILVPPLNEQLRIVSKIEERLSKVDKTLEDIDKQLLKAEALRQSILKKAFSGQLVTQDLNDEPASVLLDRIKVEREQAMKNKTPRKTKKKRTAA